MPMMNSQDSFVAEVTFKCNLNLDSLTIINTFLTNVPNLYPLKIPENQGFSGIFKGVWNGNIGQKWVDLNISWIFKVNQRKKIKNYFKNESLIFYKPRIFDIYGLFSLFPWIHANHLKNGLSCENHSTQAETKQ